MAAQKKQVSLDANFLFDLAAGEDFAHDLLEALQRKASGYVKVTKSGTAPCSILDEPGGRRFAPLRPPVAWAVPRTSDRRTDELVARSIGSARFSSLPWPSSLTGPLFHARACLDGEPRLLFR